MNHLATENKMTVATGAVDRRIGVRVATTGPVPELVLETLRRSPSEVEESAFQPTGGGIALELQYAERLAEQILRVAADARAAA